MRHHHARRAPTVLAGALFLLLPALAAPAAAQVDRYDDPGRYDETAGYDTAYSYLRVLDGSATLIQGGDYGSEGDRVQAEVNLPVLAGDRLWVAPRSRAEVLLSDGNLLRLDGETEIAFESLAFSPESGDRVTTLRLLRGNAQLVVTTDSLGDQLPRLDTPNATVYPQDFGVYRVTADGGDWTELVVRRGSAELVTGRDAVTVRADERALAEGTERPWTDVRAAAGYDGLERWAADLDRAGDYDSPYIDEDLRYAAAPLERYGRWVDVRGTRAWYPRVDAGWRPYWNGRWSHTPAGLIWISNEPWGWVPYHYGTWDYVSSYGWVWFPGRRFAPAWVYWHWGSSHVAWVPVGYYTRHYYRHYPGFRFGVYGWAGGHWNHFNDWVFCDRRFFGFHHQRQHHFRGHDWRRRHGGNAVPRGILTTDTRRLHPGVWRDGDEAIRALRTRPGAGGRVAVAEDLPDVTPFVERRGQGELPAEVAKRVAVTRGDVDRVAGTPLAPDTKAPPRRIAVARPGGGRIEADRERGEGGVARRAVGVTRGGEVRGGGPGGADVEAKPGDRGGSPRVAVPRDARPREDAGAADDRRGAAPGARAVRPRSDAPQGDDGKSDSTRGGSPRSVAQPRADAPRGDDGDKADAPRGRSPRSVAQPRADAPRGDDSDKADAPRGRSPRSVAQPRADAPRGDDSDKADAPRGRSPRSVAQPRADAPRGDDSDKADAPRGRSPRSVAQPRADAPRSGGDRGESRRAVAPRADDPRGDSRGEARRSARPRADSPRDDDRGEDGARSDARRTVRPRAANPRDGTAADRGVQARRAPRPAGPVAGDRTGRSDAGRRAPAPTARRSAPRSAPSADRPTRSAPTPPAAGRSAPRSAPRSGPSADRPTRRAPAPSAGRSAPRSAPRSGPSADRPTRRAPAPSAGRSAPRRAPSARQSSPRQAPSARRSAPPPRRAPTAGRSSSPRRAPTAGRSSSPRRSPSARQAPSRQSAPRAGAPRGGDRRPRAGSGESRGGSRRGGDARRDRGSGGAARSRGDRDRG